MAHRNVLSTSVPSFSSVHQGDKVDRRSGSPWNGCPSRPRDLRQSKVFDANKHGSIDRLDVDIYGHIFLYNLPLGLIA